MSDSLGITSTVKLQNYYLVPFLLTTIQGCFKPPKFNPPSSLPRTLPFIFSVKLCKIPLRLHGNSLPVIAANGVYQLFMISHSPVNWERQESSGMRILFCQHFLAPALAQAEAVLVINYSVFVALHSELPFSNLSNPELMSLSHRIRCIYFILFYSIVTMPAFLRSNKIKKEILSQPLETQRQGIFPSIHTRAYQEWACSKVCVDFCLMNKALD